MIGKNIHGRGMKERSDSSFQFSRVRQRPVQPSVGVIVLEEDGGDEADVRDLLDRFDIRDLLLDERD